MAGDENDTCNEPAVPKDESGNQLSEHSNEDGKRGLKEDKTEQDLKPATESESSDGGGKQDRELDSSLADYARWSIKEAFRAIVDKLVSESSQGSIHHMRMLFGMAGVQEPAKRIAGPPESRPGFFSQLLHNEAAKKDIEVSRPGEVGAAAGEAEIGPFPGEGGEVPPHSKEAL